MAASSLSPGTGTCHAAQPLTATAEQGHSLDGSAPQHQDSRSWSVGPRHVAAGFWDQHLKDRRDAGEQQKGML